MKKLYNLFILLLITPFCFSQGYELGLVSNGNYNFKVVAIPDFDTTENTNNLDAGFTLMLPAGTADVANQVGLLGGRNWDVTEYDAATIMPAGGDGTQDAFQFNLPAGSTLFQHSMGQQIDLVSFDVTNMPETGMIEFLANDDPLATTAGIFDSFYQTDLDGAGGTPTSDYFSGLAAGLENFMFSTLGVEEDILSDISVSVYPNPTPDVLNLATTNNTVSYKLFNILGQGVNLNGIVENNSKKSINLSQLPDGIYILKVEDEENLTKKTFKIIKKK